VTIVVHVKPEPQQMKNAKEVKKTNPDVKKTKEVKTAAGVGQ
jgi:hypothetical protein